MGLSKRTSMRSTTTGIGEAFLFSYMAENTTFVLMTALGMILYNWLVSLFAKRVDFVEPTFRPKAFRTHVVSVSAEWKGDTLIIFV